MDIASFVLILLGIISYAVMLFRFIVILPRVRQEGSKIDKFIQSLRVSFLFALGTWAFVAL